MQDLSTSFPLPLDHYADPAGAGLIAVLLSRLEQQPVNGVATAIFLLAVFHTFVANRFRRAAERTQLVFDEARRQQGLPNEPSFVAEMLHFLGEVEVVFGLWILVLLAAITLVLDWNTARTYLTERVHFVEPMFVVVIMTIAATRPVIGFARAVLQRLAALGDRTPAAWWFTILSIGPVLGSFITEPAAMTICALLLGRQFYALDPSPRLRYATIGLLFVNVSIGGTFTHFAAPPVLMVSGPWEWTLEFMVGHFGWKSALAIVISNLLYFTYFRGELRRLETAAAITTVDDGNAEGRVPRWIIAVNIGFLAFVVLQAHYPPLFIGAFLFFLGFARATAPYQGNVDLKAPLLVGFFLAGLVTHGALQGWWIAPVLGGLSEQPLFWTATILTAFNDNALITYLATLVPDFSESLKLAVVAGAVTGGGLTVIANAPNPAGQAILGRYFPNGVSPLWLAAAAAIPTLIAAACFEYL
jgi:hypothetical protein